MGSPKAALEWHGSTLLRRTVGLLSRSVDGPVVVVRAPGQALPTLPAGVEVLDDPAEGRGPLQGLAVGLTAVADRAGTAFLCSTDLPFLHVAYVRRVVRALDPAAHDLPPYEIVLPHIHGFRQPLAAAYSTSLAPLVTALVTDGIIKPKLLLDRSRTLVLDEAALLEDAALRAADPELDSVVNLNEPADYAAARARPAPLVTVQRFGVLASGGHRGERQVRVATLAEAADAVGLALDRYVLAAVNGDQTGRDPELPLVAGDVVAFLSADAGG